MPVLEERLTALTLRPGTPADAEECGRICYEAFRRIAERHGFPPDFPSAEVAAGLLAGLLSHPRFYSVVAELDGALVGSNFLDERSAMAGVGPITVDPKTQDSGIGRRLMVDALERGEERGFAGVRLLQSGYHTRSLSLYTKLGFAVREPLATMQGDPVEEEQPGHELRAASEADLEPCNALCRAVHGHDRAGELRDAVAQGTAQVVEHDGRLTGYTTGIAFFGHSVAETNTDLKALIGAATQFPGPGFHVPMRNLDLFRWCLERGLRMVQPMTLMSLGLYNEPAGAFLPSILY